MIYAVTVYCYLDPKLGLVVRKYLALLGMECLEARWSSSSKSISEVKGYSDMAMKNFLKQLEKNAQRDPGEKGWAGYYCGKEGHLKRHCPQASKTSLVPCQVCKGPHWKRDCPQKRRFQGSDLQDNQD